MLKCLLTAAVAIGLLGVVFTSRPTAAPAPPAPPAPKLSETEKDQANLQQTWYGVSVDRVGGAAPCPDLTITFEKDRFIFRRRNQLLMEGTYTIDASKDPKTIDMIVTSSQGDNRLKGKTVLGVYKFDKDKLQWCMFDPGFERNPLKYPPRGRPGLSPTDLGDFLFTFQKDKP